MVIGGGDGTMNWVLSAMRAEGMADVPAGCIPLGTGNDTSRAFGWGFKYKSVGDARTDRQSALDERDRPDYARYVRAQAAH